MFLTNFKKINLLILTLVILLFPVFQASAQVKIKNDANVASPTQDLDTTNNIGSAINDKYIDVNGNIFGDVNSDGIKNNGEVGLPNISLKITQIDGVVIDIVTDANGNYSFRSLSGPTQIKIDSNDPHLPIQAILTTGSIDQVVNFINSMGLTDTGFSIPLVNLNILKTVDKSTAKIQESLVYSLKFSNKGSKTATDVLVADQLPDSLEFISATYQGQNIIPAIENNSTGQKLTFTIATLDSIQVDPNQPKEILVQVKIKDTTTASRAVNQVSIISREADPDVTDNNSQATTDITRDLIRTILNTVRTGGNDLNSSQQSLLVKSFSSFLIILAIIALAFFALMKRNFRKVK